MTADLSTFAKVRALHDRTDSPGEKAAAAGRMEALARAAGMTVAEALSKLDGQAARSSGPTFDDIFNNPAHRRAQAERERERAQKWRAVVAEYGSEQAVFAPGPWEGALEAACDRFTVKLETTGWRIGSLWGWDIFKSGDPEPEIAEAIASAYPMPATVREAWAEFRFWDKLMRDREARGVGCGDPSPAVYFRTVLVERQLNTLPAGSLSDLRARLDWFDYRNALENAPDPKEEGVRLATLRADIERMGARLREQDAAPVQNGRCGDGVANLHPTGSQGPAQGADPLSSPDPGISNSDVKNGQEQGGRDPISPSPAAPEFYEEVVKPAPETGLGEHDQGCPQCGYPLSPPDLATSTTVQFGQAANPIKSGWSDRPDEIGPVEPPPASGPDHISFRDAVRRTNADKRADVLALLNVGDAHNSPLTDREIARRAGVSPTTVGTIRREQAARPASP